MNEAGPITPAARVEAPTLTGQIAAAELRAGDVLAGRFRIEAMLGVGGMGVVYRARDLSLDIDVALKLLRPELARKPEAFERFRQELLLARQVSSPHVVRIHDIAQADGRWFISMDFVDGESLERRMDLTGKMRSEDALPIARGLLEGLSAAHQRGVVHRDLKPANVLLDRKGMAYITDFGVARSLGATGGMTQSGVIFGTPEYLSPEQARGEKVDARSDLYAVGLILYEMLSGTLPFRGGTPAETVMQRIVRQPPSLALVRPDLPHWLHAFCDRLLKLNPAHRFASARDALLALDAQHVPRPPLNRRALLLALLALVGVAGVVDLALRYRTQTPAAPIVAAQTPRLALLPLQADTSAADANELRALARALEEHLRSWLRSDTRLAVVPRARVLDALARTVPDQDAAATARQLGDIARAANANLTVRGRLTRDAQQLLLELDLDGAAGVAAAQPLRVRGATVEALYAAYLAAVPGWLQSSAHPADAPTLPASALMAYGRGLLAADRNAVADAAKEFAGIAADPPSALVLRDTLDAQQAAAQDLPAQTTRETIVKTFDKSNALEAREAYAHALAANDDSAGAQRLLVELARTFPHDDALAMLRADTLSTNGEDRQAIDILKQVVRVDDQNARAWFLLGRSSIKQGEAQAAVDDYLVRALVLNTRAGNDAAVAETNNAIGVGYERLGQLDAAVEQYTRAAALREKLGDKPALAKSLRNLAIVQAERGDRVAADRALDRVKILLEGLGDRASLADLYNDRGVVAEERGDFADALTDYRQALAMRQQLDLPALVAESLNNVGYCAYQMGDFDNAGVYWQQALALFNKLDDQTRALHVAQSMALLQIARGHFARAHEELDASLRSAQDHQLPEESAVAQISLADLGLIEGRLADALAASERAQQIFVRRADQRGQSEALLQQARVALAAGDSAGADKALHAIARDKLSVEQRAAYLLADAQRAALAHDGAAADAQLDAAAKAALEAHSGTLGLDVALEQVRRALARADVAGAEKRLVALRKQTTQLSDVPRRLQWLQLELATALRNGNAANAATRYREALLLLKQSGRFRDAWLIYALGERTANGTDASAARDAATAARAQLLADAPPAERDAMQALLQRRWQEESGGGNEH